MQRIALRLPRLAAVRSASTLASGAAVESAVPAAISCLRHAAAARLAADGLGAPAARDSVWDAPGAPSSVYDSVIGDCFVPSGEAVRTPASSWLDEVVGEAPAIQAMNRNARQPKKSNHGKRPCSNVRRKRKIRTRGGDSPFFSHKKKKGVDA